MHRLILLFVVSLAFAHLASAADRSPNIVFIFADDWGWGDLSCHGSKSYHTPNIDRLAAQGVDFQQFNVCNPVCSPSRTAAMTGHFPARYGVYQHFAEHELNRQRGCPIGSIRGLRWFRECCSRPAIGPVISASGI